MSSKRSNLEKAARQQMDEFLRRSSLTYLECCISLMLTHMPTEEAAEILEAEARIVRELG